MHRAWRWIAVSAAVLACLYIWHFSLANGERSALTSGRALELINRAFAKTGADFRFSHHTVRKIGHFVGYFALGALVSRALWALRVKGYPILAISLCVAAAAVDEWIQLFSPGRVASLADILLDSAGAACGILLFSLPVWALSAVLKNKAKKVEK